MALPQNGDFSKLLGNGENPNGMIAQTPNGTERNGTGSDGSTWRYAMADGPRWNDDPTPRPPPLTPVEEDPAVPAMPKNRVAVGAHTRRKPR